MIPENEWVEFPKTLPKRTGYYFTYYYHKEVNEYYYKCIFYNAEINSWISWKPFKQNFFQVIKFIEKTRSDFYCPCRELTEKLYKFRLPDSIIY